MSMQTLTKSLADESTAFFGRHQTYNAQNQEMPLSALRWFRKHAEDEHGLGPNEAALAKREAHFLRRFRVREHEIERDRKVRDFARNTWALERLWHDQGCPFHGEEAPTVEKAFTTTALQTSFPIFFETFIMAGLLAAPILNRLVNETVTVANGIITHAEFVESTYGTTPTFADYSNPMLQATEMGEGTRHTQLTFTTAERTLRLRKFGFEALASYEAVRRTRLPIFTQGLERAGLRLQTLLTEFALDVLILGDSTTPFNNAAPTDPATVAASPSYADVVRLMLGYPEGYEPDLGIADRDVMANLLAIPEFKDPNAGFTFQRTGQMITPVGIPLVRWDSKGISSGYTDDKLVLIDTSNALVQFIEGGLMTETDRDIRQGWNIITVSIWTTFAKRDANSVRVGTSYAT